MFPVRGIAPAGKPGTVNDEWKNRAGKTCAAARKPAVIRSQEKKWHVIPEQSAAFAAAKAPSFF
jgi:hypothetical protein